MRPPIDYDQPERYEACDGVYARILREAAHIPRCSDNKTAALRRPVRYAIRRCYMQINRPDWVSWLVFDLDHANALIWSATELAPPNMIVRDPRSGHAHLYYAINPVYTGESARSHPQRYLQAIYEAYGRRLGADPACRGPVAKTPGHCHWETIVLHERVYDLGALAQHVELPPKDFRRPARARQRHSRHCILFDDMRLYAYRIVDGERQHGTYARFVRQLEAFAIQANTFTRRGFAEDLSQAQLRATVKSVARWTWDRYAGARRCRRGLLALDASLALDERQRLGASHTHGIRREASAAKIATACLLLREQGQALTLSAVARAAGLARQTVARYRHLLDGQAAIVGDPVEVEPAGIDQGGLAGAAAASDPPAAGAAAATAGPVTFGAHQIPGALRGVDAARAHVVELHERVDDG